MIRRLAMSGLGVVLLASATVALAETKQDPKAPAKPALTAEEQAELQQMKDLDKRLRIARLELALAEAKEAPEKEIATKAEGVYRLQGEMHAFRVKHPGIGRLMRQEGHRWGGGPGMGRGGRRGMGGRGGGMGRGGRHGMGGRGGGMGRGGRHGMGGRGGGMAAPWAGEGRGRGMGHGQGRGMGLERDRGMGRGGGMRGRGGGRGMGRRWQQEVEPAPPVPVAPEAEPAPEAPPAK